jgi:hypothetical protein
LAFFDPEYSEGIHERYHTVAKAGLVEEIPDSPYGIEVVEVFRLVQPAG